MFAARKTDGAATAAAANYIEDVFSTYLYTGNGSVQTIPNSIALGSAYGGSVFFNGGASTALTVSNATAFDFGTGDFTIECFAYVTSQIGSFTMICATDNVNQYWGFGSVGSGGMTMYAGTSGTDIYSGSGSNPSLNQWNHLVWQRSSGVASMYLNGTRVYNAAYTADFGSDATGFRIGQSNNYANYYTTGYISNLRVVKGSAVYSGATITVPTSPLSSVTNTQLLTCQTPNTVLDYSSNAFTITVTNAIAQNGGGPFTDSTANKGGLVWLKGRSAATDHALYDTNRGATFDLVSNSTAAQTAQTTGLTSFNSNGFSIGSLAKLNTNSATYASWTFRKQAKFFDVVTYTGNGANRTIAHNLGSVPGCIMVKRTDSTGNWRVYHRGLTSAAYSVLLNLTNAESTATSVWNSTAPTSTEFSVGTATDVNASGGTYVAYLFAHDAGGFGAAGTDNVISCGTYLGSNHRAQEVVQLGYEPQFVMIKNITTVQQWVLVDNMRGMARGGSQAWLAPNASTAETTTASDRVVADARGFYFDGAQAPINQAGSTFIYIAIRRGPMKTPTTGTSVFSPTIVASIGATSAASPSPTDLSILKPTLTTVNSWRVVDRLRGNDLILSTNATSAESTEPYYKFDTQSGLRLTSWPVANSIFYNLKRAPGFFDVVCYTGTGSNNRTVTHNLGVAPELMIIKCRTALSDWAVYANNDNTDYLQLNSVAATADSSGYWNDTSPTASVFSVGGSINVNANAATYVAYLFATVTGVSKVGSYTGNGSSQTINCGFTAGARFVMIKRIDSTGNWYVWDTARGIVAGNDPRLSLNSTAAEVTTDDSIDPDNSGFTVNQLSATDINVNAATYIYLAIA